MEAQRSSPDVSGFQTHAFLSLLCKSGGVQRSQDIITGSVLLLAWLGVLPASKPMFPYCIWPSAGSLGTLTRAALSPGFSHPCACYFYHVWDLLLSLLSATCPGLDPHPALCNCEYFRTVIKLVRTSGSRKTEVCT